MYSADAPVTPPAPSPFSRFLPARLWAAASARRSRVSADELQRRYLSGVLNYVAGRIPPGDAAEAEDITADVFAAAFASLGRCPAIPDASVPTSEHDPARAYLFGIARRKVADWYRLRARRPQSALHESHPAPHEQSPEPQYLAGEAAQTLHALLSSLPNEQGEALRLRYLDDLSLSEIGQILGKSPGAVA